MLKQNISDSTGRALEFIIVNYILLSDLNVSVDDFTKKVQIRDKLKFDSLIVIYQERFIK